MSSLLPKTILSLCDLSGKLTDSRTTGFSGLGQIELDAVKPEMLAERCENAIRENLDEDLYEELQQTEAIEREAYQGALRAYVDEL